MIGATLALSLLAGAGGAFASQQQAYDEIIGRVAEIRQLAPQEAIDIQFKTRQELREFVIQDIEEHYPEDEQEADLRALVIFGLVEPGTDLAQMQIDLLGEQVAGYYDPEADEMVVVSSGDSGELSASDELTFAHETVHALQDQHFDLMAVQGDHDAVDDDTELAVTALIEGDATIGQIEYLFDNPLLLRDLQDELTEVDSSALDDAPRIFSETLLFPYEEGADFVDSLFNDGGWDAVNAAYANPPQSTEQVLHPEKYVAGEEPMTVDLQDPLPTLGDGWQTFDDNVMGEFITSVFLDSYGVDGDEAELASEGWGGDRYVVVGTEEDTALVWSTAWDTEDDAEEFFAALTQHELRRFDTRPSSRGDAVVRFEGDGIAGEIRRQGDRVLYVLAPDAATLDVLIDSQRP